MKANITLLTTITCAARASRPGPEAVGTSGAGMSALPFQAVGARRPDPPTRFAAGRVSAGDFARGQEGGASDVPVKGRPFWPGAVVPSGPRGLQSARWRLQFATQQGT